MSSLLYYEDFCIDYTKITKQQINNAKSLQLQNALFFLKQWFGKTQKFVFKTSGSTGIPKKITFNKSQLVHSAKQTINFFKLNEADTFLVCLDVNMVAGKMMIARAALINSNILLVEPKSNPLKKLKHEVSFAAFVPLQMQAILMDEESISKLKNIKKIIIGGTALNNTLESEILKHKLNAWHTYGMTETLTHVALKKIGSNKNYKPLTGVKIKLNSHGCLCIKYPPVQAKWITTNDLAKIYRNNTFKIIGRADFVINSGGYKIHPEMLETVISKTFNKQLQNVPFFVGSIKDKTLGNKCVLFIESNSPIHLDISLLKNHLNKYQIPKQIICLPRFTFTSSGKINRIKTIQLFEKQ
ncbi:MAG: AMP-binding protein [Bacteroidia bacterium]